MRVAMSDMVTRAADGVRAAARYPADVVRRLRAARRTQDPNYPDTRRVPYTGRTQAGVFVTPDTAVTVPAVWACLRYLSQTVAMLPWHAMQKAGNGGTEIAEMHPINWMLWKRPSPEWSSFQFRETLTHWALRWGNGYAEIERDIVGRPIALHPIHPERVEVCRDRETGRLYYDVNNGTGGTVRLDPMDVFHIRGFGEGPVGVNVMAYAAESIGWARAAQLFGAAFLGSGMGVPGVLSFKGKLTEGGREEARKEFERTYGGPRGKKVFIGDNDADFKPFVTDPEKGQFISTNQHLIEEVCRWFGVPPHKIAHLLRSTFNNIEHQAIEVVQDSILPWAKRFEEEADYKLFGQNRRGYFTKINLMGLLRGDFKSQAEGFQIYRNIGVVSADDIRERLDMNRLPPGSGGEKYVMQSQYTTLDKVGELPPAPEPAEPEPDPDDPDEDAAIEEIERMSEEESADA